MMSRTFLIFVLCLSFSVNATELDLHNPHATFKSCMFYQYKVVPIDIASNAISSCYTKDGKIDLLAYLLVGLIILDAFESSGIEEGETKESKLGKILSKYGGGIVDETFESNVLALETTELNSFVLELIELTNEYDLPGEIIERELLDLKYEEEKAFGTIASARSESEKEYKISFKKLPKGWLIHEISNID